MGRPGPFDSAQGLDPAPSAHQSGGRDCCSPALAQRARGNWNQVSAPSTGGPPGLETRRQKRQGSGRRRVGAVVLFAGAPPDSVARQAARQTHRPGPAGGACGEANFGPSGFLGGPSGGPPDFPLPHKPGGQQNPRAHHFPQDHQPGRQDPGNGPGGGIIHESPDLRGPYRTASTTATAPCSQAAACIRMAGNRHELWTHAPFGRPGTQRARHRRRAGTFGPFVGSDRRPPTKKMPKASWPPSCPGSDAVSCS